LFIGIQFSNLYTAVDMPARGRVVKGKRSAHPALSISPVRARHHTQQITILRVIMSTLVQAFLEVVGRSAYKLDMFNLVQGERSALLKLSMAKSQFK
jgi:hypothetical protein